jgi:hypothetical protein
MPVEGRMPLQGSFFAALETTIALFGIVPTDKAMSSLKCNPKNPKKLFGGEKSLYYL